MDATNNQIGIIILAAGASRRMKKPKQLLEYNGETFIRRAVETASQSNFQPVIVVLGAHFDEIKKEIENFECLIARSESWQSGMASSIRAGIEKLLAIAPQASAVVISLCDQPLIESRHFSRLTEAFHQTKKPIVASRYRETAGVPALFAREFFTELLKLEGDRGAREIIRNYPDAVEKVPISEAAVDIDTEEDFKKLQSG